MRSTTSSPTVEPGLEVLPGYRVVSLLSRGRRIDTYDVYSAERDCRCVVKMLRPDRRHEQAVREAVLLEGRLLRDLSHPHLVRAYEVSSEPGPAMVLETLPGATLAALIEEAPLGLEDGVELGLQLVSVLGYLHRQGWLHLDVKPSNIVVGSGRATLIDLSLAARPGVGHVGAGTPGYLAPEQEAGRHLSPATDVWGLGVTLFETLAGRLPRVGWGMRDALARRGLRARLGPHLPPEAAELLQGCLAPDPRRRPDLNEIQAQLRQLAHQYEGARPVRGSGQRPTRRGRSGGRMRPRLSPWPPGRLPAEVAEAGI